MISSQESVISYQLSVISYQLSVISDQLPGVSSKNKTEIDPAYNHSLLVATETVNPVSFRLNERITYGQPSDKSPGYKAESFPGYRSTDSHNFTLPGTIFDPTILPPPTSRMKSGDAFFRDENSSRGQKPYIIASRKTMDGGNVQEPG